MYSWRTTDKTLLFLVFLFCVFLIFHFSSVEDTVKNFAKTPATNTELQSEAERIVGECATQDNRPECYDETIPRLMDNGFSMEEAFMVTTIIQGIDDGYPYCHVLGHELSAKETAKDPSLWKDVVARSPLGVCSNGGVHGAFQERFRVESFAEGDDYLQIIPELEGVCQPREGWQPTRMGQATCVHALGHLTMYITGGDIYNSLDLCDRLLVSEGVRQLCYDGAFMQMYQPLEPEDFALIEGKEIETKEASQDFCSQFTNEAQRSSCVSESWPLYRDVMQTAGSITHICDTGDLTGQYYARCMDAVFYVAMAQSGLSVDWATDFCAAVPAGYGGRCFGNSASRLIEVDSRNVEKALQLCKSAPNTEIQTACYDELFKYSAYTFSVGSPPFYELCHGLPESYRSPCLNQTPLNHLQ